DACSPVAADNSFRVTGSERAASASSRRMARSMTWIAIGEWAGACSLSEPGAMAGIVEVALKDERRTDNCASEGKCRAATNMGFPYCEILQPFWQPGAALGWAARRHGYAASRPPRR